MGLFFLRPIWPGNTNFMRHFFPTCGNPARLYSRINPEYCPNPSVLRLFLTYCILNDHKILATSESKLNWIINMVKMWGYVEPKQVCSGSCEKRSACEWKLEMILDEMVRIPSLEEVKQFEFPGMVDSVMQKDKLAFKFTAKEWILRGISHLDKVLALLVFGYLLWTQQWVIINTQEIDRTRQDCYWGWGKVPCGSNVIFYLPGEKGAEAYVG